MAFVLIVVGMFKMLCFSVITKLSLDINFGVEVLCNDCYDAPPFIFPLNRFNKTPKISY